MVRTEVAPAKIVGGFVLVEVAWLMSSWRACRAAPLSVGDFRTLLAAHEMVARRSKLPDGRHAAYGLAELARLLGITTKRAAASLRRLEAAGLIAWSETAIVFPDQVLEDEGPVLDAIGRGRGSVAIPRRMLRLLAGGVRPALIAAALGVLLRCLSRRRGGFDGRGRVKASWVARVFDVDQRRVKAARSELVSLGWISPEPDHQRAMNRWGRAYRIDLAWDRDRAGGSNLPPPPPADRPEIATPSVDQEPLPERGEHQEPAGRGPAGVRPGGREEGKPGPAHTNSAPVSTKPVSALPAPRLDDVRVEDLRDTGRLLQLHAQAVDRDLVTTSEADRLGFMAAAEHALAIGKGNPPGLFAYLIRSRAWRYSTQLDEDRARNRLRDRDRGGRPEVDLRSSLQPQGLRRIGAVEVDGLSADARLVREVRQALIRAGMFRDPWPAFQARNPGWDRGRWDRSMAELGLS